MVSAGPPLGGATRLRSALSSQTVTFLSLIISLSVSCESYCHLISQLLVDSEAPKPQNHHPLWPLPGSLDPTKTLLPHEPHCNPAHSEVPGPVRDPGHAQDIPKASKMRSKAIPSI